MSANDRQVGGTHYKTGGEEHWDRVWRLHGRGYFVGCITKYVERYHLKNGVQDLEKARHFIDKLIELEKANDHPELDSGIPGPGYVDQGRDRPIPGTVGPYPSASDPGVGDATILWEGVAVGPRRQV